MAAARLGRLLANDRMGLVSDEAYRAGLVELTMRVGPAGEIKGLSKEVRVQILDPRPIPTGIRLPLRWIATGRGGHLFPVLDADLDLCRTGRATSELTITARYQPPFGGLGEHVDRVLLYRAAESTVRQLLRRLASALVRPDELAKHPKAAS